MTNARVDYSAVGAALRLVVLVGTALSLPAVGSPDVTVVEERVGKVGDRNLAARRVTYIKGFKMRIDSTLEGKTTTRLYDAAGGEVLSLDPQKKEAVLKNLGTEELDRRIPLSKVTVEVSATGRTRECLGGRSCEEHAIQVKVPADREMTKHMIFSGLACVVKEGVEEYAAVHAAARQKGLLVRPTGKKDLELAIARAAGEFDAAVGRLGGMPFFREDTLAFEGGGLLMGLLRKKVAGTWSTTVSSISRDPIPEETFAVPSGFKKKVGQ